MTLFIIQCAKSKKSYPCSAKEMYASTKFNKIFDLLNKISDSKIKIFSAKYGLLNPDDIIESYSCTLQPLPPGYVWNYSREEILNYRNTSKENTLKVLPILTEQIKLLNEIPYIILSKAYKECYIKAGGKFILNLQDKSGGTYFIYETVKSKLEELKLISNNNLFDF